MVRRSIYFIVGTLAPIACLVFDPVVFRGNEKLATGHAFLGAWRAFGWTATILAAVMFGVAVVRQRSSAFQAGMLYAASAVALILGIAMIPVTIVGLVYGIGILGLWPFVAAWLYFKHARTQRASLLGALAFLAIPAAIQLLTIVAVRWGVAHAGQPAGVHVLRGVSVLYDADALVERYASSRSPEERRRLAIAYTTMTDRPIDVSID